MLNLYSLRFGYGNAKLSQTIGTFSLPAGWTCPGANLCKSMANRETGRITDGKKCQFRCYAASEECVFTPARNQRWFNFETIKRAKGLQNKTNLIQNSLPLGINILRLHVAGDFYTEEYFVAWLNIALNNPNLIIYGYTKMIPFLVKYKNKIPKNFRFTASKGGKWDSLIEKHNLKFAEVVFSTEEARLKGLDIDHDDSLAIYSEKSFALLLHGCQPAGSEAAESLKELKKQGLGTYNKKDKKLRITNKNVPIKVILN